MRKCFAAGAFLSLVVWLTTTVTAQPPIGGRGGPGFDNSFLLKNKSVREEIKLTTDQVAKIEPKLKDLEEKRMELFKEVFAGGGGKGKFDKEQIEKMQEKMKELTAPFDKFVDTTLQDEQKARLKQIKIQMMAMGAFRDPEISSKLKLTEEQTTKITAMSTEFTKEMRELTKDRTNPEETMKKVKALQKETMGSIVKMLEKDQKTTWESMVGSPFELVMENPFGGFPKKKE